MFVRARKQGGRKSQPNRHRLTNSPLLSSVVCRYISERERSMTEGVTHSRRQAHEAHSRARRKNFTPTLTPAQGVGKGASGEFR